jgi:uncharacterized protein YdeI (YjbR/CyaY-like superfamily)
MAGGGNKYRPLSQSRSSEEVAIPATSTSALRPKFFTSAAAFRLWLEKHHASQRELWVGFHKKGSGRPSLTWPESVDAALCFGWIDGIRKRVDECRYTIRFTPRKPGSNWSTVNVKRMGELIKLGLMRPAGLKAFEQRQQEKSGVYSYEQRKSAQLDGVSEERFSANHAAWEFFQQQPPGYRRLAVFWVVSAKKEETRQKRLSTLIADSAQHRRIGPLARSPSRSDPHR